MVTNAADIHQMAGGNQQTQASDQFGLVSSAEIDQQIATAHKYPRSITNFREQTLQLVTLNESVAGECVYSLPRAGTNIEGPSARFAEIVINTWGNCRSGARVIDEGREFVTAQGVFHDLQSNSVINYEVQRRITDKNGKRYKADMIGVTANAACSIALRNAALKGVPKAFWADLYEAARKTIMGEIETLANRRKAMLEYLVRYGVTEDVVLQFVKREGVEDITLDDMVQLRGLSVALKDGETTLEKINAELNKNAPPAPKAEPAAQAQQSAPLNKGQQAVADAVEDVFAPEEKPAPAESPELKPSATPGQPDTVDPEFFREADKNAAAAGQTVAPDGAEEINF